MYEFLNNLHQSKFIFNRIIHELSEITLHTKSPPLSSRSSPSVKYDRTRFHNIQSALSYKDNVTGKFPLQ